MAKTTYDKCIVYVNRVKGNDATFEKLSVEEQVSLTEKEAEELNLLSAQTGIRYYLPEPEKKPEGHTPVEYNDQGFSPDGYDRAGKYDKNHDKSL